MNGHGETITLHQKTWHQACLVFMLLAVKKVTTKTDFLYYGI